MAQVHSLLSFFSRSEPSMCIISHQVSTIHVHCPSRTVAAALSFHLLTTNHSRDWCVLTVGVWCSIYDKWSLFLFFYVPSITMALICLSLCLHILQTIHAVKKNVTAGKSMKFSPKGTSDLIMTNCLAPSIPVLLQQC